MGQKRTYPGAALSQSRGDEIVTLASKVRARDSGSLQSELRKGNETDDVAFVDLRHAFADFDQAVRFTQR